MSVVVAIPDLPDTIATYDLAFLVSVSGSGQPRFLAQRPRVEEGPMLVVDKAGEGTRKAADGKAVAVLYPNPDLPDTIATYDLAFLVSVSGSGQPRFLAQRPRVEEGPMLVVDKAGEGTRKAADGKAVAVLYPNPDPSKHALIVDGTAELRGEELWITPTGAILHIPR